MLQEPYLYCFLTSQRTEGAPASRRDTRRSRNRGCLLNHSGACSGEDQEFQQPHFGPPAFNREAVNDL